MNARDARTILTAALCLLWGFTAAAVAASPGGLVAHYRLAGDARDSSGHRNHGVVHGVTFDTGQNATFDGIDDYIEVPDSKSLDLGTGDFSVAAWVHTAAELDDTLGDILSKYDPAIRTGTTLSILNYSGVASAQPNHRNLFFGIDAARIDYEWFDCGRPGEALSIFAMAVYDGKLYVGTFEAGHDKVGHVYRYEGGTEWVDCGCPNQCNMIPALAVYNGKLYAGGTRRNVVHDGMSTLPNQNPGGKVYRYEGGTTWTDCGGLGEADTVMSLTVFRGKLYGTTMYWSAKGLYRYDGGKKWTFCGNPGQRVGVLGVYNGNLYATSFDGCGFFRYDGGTDWTRLKSIPETTQTYSIAVHQGKMCVGTWPNGLVYRYDDPDTWTSLGRIGDETEIEGMVVYNGKLFAGTLPLARVYRYDGSTTWNYTGNLDLTPNAKYRRVWPLAVYQGKLFAGTLPSGHIFSLEAGKCVTYDRELRPGWRHIAAVKQAGLLKLYVDGRLVAQSTAFNPRDYDLSNTQPLKIGLGQHDYFNGRMKDLRIYRRALGEAEIRDLSKQRWLRAHSQMWRATQNPS